MRVHEVDDVRCAAARRPRRHHPTQRNEHQTEQVEKEWHAPKRNPLIEFAILAPRRRMLGRGGGGLRRLSHTAAHARTTRSSPWCCTARRSAQNITAM